MVSENETGDVTQIFRHHEPMKFGAYAGDWGLGEGEFYFGIDWDGWSASLVFAERRSANNSCGGAPSTVSAILADGVTWTELIALRDKLDTVIAAAAGREGERNG